MVVDSILAVEKILRDTMKGQETSFSTVTKELTDLYEKKNADYGDSFTKTYELFGDMAVASRLHDKMSRIFSLITKDEKDIKIKGEALHDTVKDLVNYGIMWLVELEKKEQGTANKNKLGDFFIIEVATKGATEQGGRLIYDIIANSTIPRFVSALRRFNPTEVLITIDQRPFLENRVLRIELKEPEKFVRTLLSI